MSAAVKRIKLAVASASNSIRNKFKQLYSDRQETTRLLNEQYKPITKSLSALHNLQAKRKIDAAVSKNIDMDMTAKRRKLGNTRSRPRKIIFSTIRKSVKPSGRISDLNTRQNVFPSFRLDMDDNYDDYDDESFTSAKSIDDTLISYDNDSPTINTKRKLNKRQSVDAITNELNQELQQQQQQNNLVSDDDDDDVIATTAQDIALEMSLKDKNKQQQQIKKKTPSSAKSLIFSDDDELGADRRMNEMKKKMKTSSTVKRLAKHSNSSMLPSPSTRMRVTRRSNIPIIDRPKKTRRSLSLSATAASTGQGLINLSVKETRGIGGGGGDHTCPNIITYWNNVNELVNRLRLLTASTSSGHTGHNNEMTSIIEELREANVIE